MRKAVPALILALSLCISSCKDTWDEDDKKALKTSCLDDARTWAGTEEKADSYCNCVLEKILKKYPHENDALEHMDSIIKDSTVLSCRFLIAK
jgi:hypothetical protein